jgi:subtilisin family serine protease
VCGGDGPQISGDDERYEASKEETNVTIAETTYRILGRVTDARTHSGLEGLRVEAWDKDLIFDDLAGGAVTDGKGAFRIEFDRSRLEDLFLDRRPDLYFKVFYGRRLIHSTEDSVLWNVDAAETSLEIEVNLPFLRLDERARTRCTASVRRLLLMSEQDILARKETDDTRMAEEQARLDRDQAEAVVQTAREAAPILERTTVTPHPVFGACVVERLKPLLIKVRAIVHFTGNQDDLESLGIEVHSHVHDVFTITATRDQLADLADQPATRRIQTPRKFEYSLEVAGQQAEVDQIHTLGTGGDGVVLGVIDSGLNVRHHTFRDPTTHDTRVLYMWVQEELPGAPGVSPEAHFAADYAPGTSPFDGMNYGVLYTDAEIDAAIGSPPTFGDQPGQIAIDPADAGGHGSHVAGIAAGNGMDGSWTQGPNVGAAPESDIVFVATDLDEDHALDAANFIFAIAEERNQPAAINMSFGSFMGPHDGESDYDRAQDDLLDANPGRAIVRTSGNDNNDEGFRTGELTVGQTEPGWVLDPNSSNVLLDLWSAGAELDCHLACGADDTGWILAGDEYLSSSDGQVNGYDIEIYRDYETRPGLHNLLVFIPDAGADDWTIRLRNSGTADARYWTWCGTRADLDDFQIDAMTLGDTGCCKGVLTVGGCLKPVDGDPEEIDDYSGCGPTMDGRIKPEITAVGSDVLSAASTVDDGYIPMDGTSMAAPMVTGSIALLLENDPDLAQDEIKGLLTQTADRTALDIDPSAPGFDETERNQYGFGRLRMLTPFNHSLPLRDVDVWVRTADDDYGFEPYPGGCFCHAPEVTVLDGTGNEVTELTWGSEYQVRVTIHNQGDTPAIDTSVRIKYTRPWLAPDDWVACEDPSDTAIEDTIVVPALSAVDHTFTQRWRPEESELPAGGAEWGDHFCLLVELNDPTHPDDPLLYDDRTAAGSDPWTRNVKGTNNVALRNLHIH